MTVYSTCSEWAVAQKTGSPDSKLLLVLLAFDIDQGEPGATAARLGRRAEIGDGYALHLAVHELLHGELIEIVGTDRGNPVYAPKGWQ